MRMNLEEKTPKTEEEICAILKAIKAEEIVMIEVVETEIAETEVAEATAVDVMIEVAEMVVEAKDLQVAKKE